MGGGLALRRSGHAKGDLSAAHAIVSSRQTGRAAEDSNSPGEGHVSRKIVARCQNYESASRLVAQSDMLLTMPRGLAESINKYLGNKIHPLPLHSPSFAFTCSGTPSVSMTRLPCGCVRYSRQPLRSTDRYIRGCIPLGNPDKLRCGRDRHNGGSDSRTMPGTGRQQYKETQEMRSCSLVLLIAGTVVGVTAFAADYSPNVGPSAPKKLLRGDTHLHSGWSADAGAFGNRLGPEARCVLRGRGGDLIDRAESASGSPARLGGDRRPRRRPRPDPGTRGKKPADDGHPTPGAGVS